MAEQQTVDNPRESSIFSRWFSPICPCVPAKRKVVPLNIPPPNSKFVLVGKEKKRSIRVVHVTSGQTRNLTLSTNRTSGKADETLPDSKDYDSDSSADEYWFTKWTLPFQMVKKLQQESFRRRNGNSGILNRMSIRFSARRKSKRAERRKTEACDNEKTEKDLSLSTYANNLASQIVKEAEIQASPLSLVIRGTSKSTSVASTVNDGIVNLSFAGSPEDPDSLAFCRESRPSIVKPLSPLALKPLLFFIHGAGESSDYWSNLMQYFSALDYEVLALDLLGHGYSTAPSNPKFYTFQKLYRDVENVFDAHVREGQKSIIIGHGYGCSLAVKLCRTRSSSVCLMALLSSGGPTPLAPSFDWRNEFKWPVPLADCLRPFLSCGLKKRVLYGARGKSSIYRTENIRSLPRYVVCNLARGQSWLEGDVAYHRKIHVPTLLVHGMRDPHVSLVEMCEMERTIPRAFLEVIPEAGHDVPADSPRELCKMLRKFFENWER